MSVAQLLSMLGSLGAVLEPILMNLETNQVKPELDKIISGVSSPDLKALLQVLADGIDAFVQLELKKLS